MAIDGAAALVAAAAALIAQSQVLLESQALDASAARAKFTLSELEAQLAQVISGLKCGSSTATNDMSAGSPIDSSGHHRSVNHITLAPDDVSVDRAGGDTVSAISTPQSMAPGPVRTKGKLTATFRASALAVVAAQRTSSASGRSDGPGGGGGGGGLLSPDASTDTGKWLRQGIAQPSAVWGSGGPANEAKGDGEASSSRQGDASLLEAPIPSTSRGAVVEGGGDVAGGDVRRLQSSKSGLAMTSRFNSALKSSSSFANGEAAARRTHIECHRG